MPWDVRAPYQIGGVILYLRDILIFVLGMCFLYCVLYILRIFTITHG